MFLLGNWHLCMCEWGHPNSENRGPSWGWLLLSLAAGQVNCTPGEVSCTNGICVGAIQLCDGLWDCSDGADEGPGYCSLPSLPTAPAGTLPGPFASSQETAPTPLASASPGEASEGRGLGSQSCAGLGESGGGASQREVGGAGAGAQDQPPEDTGEVVGFEEPESPAELRV